MRHRTYNYTLNNSQFSVEYEKADRHTVSTGRFRPNRYLPTSPISGALLAVTAEYEFLEDLQYQIGFLKYAVEGYEQDLSGAMMTNAIIVACENHIRKHNRLIDTDLYTYIDVNFHILNSMKPMADFELGHLYSGLVQEMINTFKDSIYISDPILGLRKLI